MENRPTVAVQIVSPEQALLWLGADKYAHQRRLNQVHVSFLAEEMRQMAFKQDTVIEFCLVGGSEWLTDGQHRLAAVILSGIPQRFVVVRRPMLDEEEVAIDYTRTDKGRPRTIYEDYKSLDLDAELGLTFTQINYLGAAIQFIDNGFKSGAPRRMHSKPRLALMRDYAEAAEAFFEHTAGAAQAMRSKLDRRATLSVALVTFKYSAETFGDKVKEFWNGVATDDGLRATDPRKHAVKHLVEKTMAGSTSSGNNVSVAYSSRIIARCFNGYVANEQMKFVKVTDATQPILIAGSPFDGKGK